MATARARRVGRGRSSKSEATHAGRKDPTPRHVNGVRPFGVVCNQDPSYDYHFWPENETAHGLAEAEADGWETVVRQDPKVAPDAERLQGGTTAKLGEPIRSRGLVLTRRPKELGEQAVAQKQAFVQQLQRDVGAEGGTARQRWNRSRVMERDPSPMPQGMEETVQATHGTYSEGNPYPAFQE